MTAATLGGVVGFQLLPYFLRELQPQRLILCGGIEFAPQVTPHLGRGLDVRPQAWKECGWYVAVAAARLNAEYIGGVHAARQLLIGLLHFVAGSTERIGFGHFQATEKTARKTDAEDEAQHPAGRYAEQEPTLRAPPQPSRNSPVSWRRHIHPKLVDTAMTTLHPKRSGNDCAGSFCERC